MNIQFLGQGYKPVSSQSVGYNLINCFSDLSFQSFIGFCAFTSQSAVNGLSEYILAGKDHLTTITFITGIDQKGTSKEALEALLALDVNTYIFYQPASTIYHPKIYLFEGETISKLIVGSSNMTGSGLFTNVEASLLITIDNTIEIDRKIISDIKSYYGGIFDGSDPNMKRITAELIERLVARRIVPTEAQRKSTYESTKETGENTPEDDISSIFPRRIIPRIPRNFTGSAVPRENPDEPTAPPTPPITSPVFALGELLWESGPLTERDLTIPSGSNTHATGSMLFKMGLMQGIDQRHYFRDEVFSNIDWEYDNRQSTNHIERAQAIFNIKIHGHEYGSFQLRLSHNTKTDTKSYRQNNCMTSLSWGEARSIIARRDLIGSSARLYRNADEFILEIV